MIIGCKEMRVDGISMLLVSLLLHQKDSCYSYNMNEES
ncbi:hypothetical protein bwei_5493 [Bacillus mycoides]|nr:hypothetical protein bwei_5493 [Bacillus mycoides]